MGTLVVPDNSQYATMPYFGDGRLLQMCNSKGPEFVPIPHYLTNKSPLKRSHHLVSYLQRDTQPIKHFNS